MCKELKNMNHYFKIAVDGIQRQERVKANLCHKTGKTYMIFMKGIFLAQNSGLTGKPCTL